MIVRGGILYSPRAGDERLGEIRLERVAGDEMGREEIETVVPARRMLVGGFGRAARGAAQLGGLREGVDDEPAREAVLLPPVPRVFLQHEGVLGGAAEAEGGDDAPVRALLRRDAGERARAPEADDVARVVAARRGEANAARVRRPRQAARAPRVDVLRGLRPEEIHHRLARVRHARLEQSARGAGDGHDPAEALRGAARDVHHRAHGRGVHRLQRHPQRGLHRDAPKWHEREEVERSEEVVDERNGASTVDDGFL